jgi:hypothetical protein
MTDREVLPDTHEDKVRRKDNMICWERWMTDREVLPDTHEDKVRRKNISWYVKISFRSYRVTRRTEPRIGGTLHPSTSIRTYISCS